MGTQSIRFTKRDGTPFTGSLVFSTNHKYARDSAGTNVAGSCTATDLGEGVVSVSTPATGSVGVGFLVEIDASIADVFPRAHFVSDGPWGWVFGSTLMEPVANIGLAASNVTVTLEKADGTSSGTTVTAVAAGSTVDGVGAALYSVLRFPLPDGTGWRWAAKSKARTPQIFPREGGHNVPGNLVLPAAGAGATTKVIRFTDLNGAPFTGALTFATYPEFRRDASGTKMASVITDLGGGYVAVSMPWLSVGAAACSVNIAAGITDVSPRTQLVSFGSSVWLFGSVADNPTPNMPLTPSSVDVMARTFGSTAETKLATTGAGGFALSATPDDIGFSVLRFDYPGADSYTWQARPRGATILYPGAGTRDVRSRVVYPENTNPAKLRWVGDASSRLGRRSQWTEQFGVRGQVGGTGPIDVGGGVITEPGGYPRIVERRDEMYLPNQDYSVGMTVQAGDRHSDGSRAEFTALGSNPNNWFYEGDDVWISWATLFPADFVQNSGWSVFSQAHQNLDLGNGGPPIAFTINETDNLHMTVMNGVYDALGRGSEARRWTGKMQRGFWQHFLLHIKWSQDMAIGFQELWVDGVLALPKFFHNNLDSDAMTYWKLGFYRNKSSVSAPQTVMHDGFRVYTSDPRILGEVPVNLTGAVTLGGFEVTGLGTVVDPGIIIDPPVDPGTPGDWLVVAPSFYNRYEQGPFGDPKMNGLEGPMFLLKPLLIAEAPLYCVACSRASYLLKLQFCWAHYEDYLNSKEYQWAEKQTMGLTLSRLAFAERVRYQLNLPDIQLKVPITPQ